MDLANPPDSAPIAIHDGPSTYIHAIRFVGDTMVETTDWAGNHHRYDILSGAECPSSESPLAKKQRGGPVGRPG